MTDRKRKLRFIQASLLLLGALIIFMTYGKKERKENDEIISKKTQERIELQIDKKILTVILFLILSIQV